MTEEREGGRRPGLTRRQAGPRQRARLDSALRILVLGGERERELLELLRTVGLTGEAAGGVADARQRLEETDWDLLICAGPPDSWAGLVAGLRVRGGLAVLAVLEAADPVTVMAAVRAGIHAYTVVPVTAEGLAERIELALGRARRP